MENAIRNKLNGWLRIIAVMIPLVIAGGIWAVTQNAVVDTLKSEVTFIKQENNKVSEKVTELKIEQAKIRVQLDNIEKLLIEIKQDIRK